MENFPNNSNMPNFMECILHCEKLRIDVEALIIELGDFLNEISDRFIKKPFSKI